MPSEELFQRIDADYAQHLVSAAGMRGPFLDASRPRRIGRAPNLPRRPGPAR
jgi:hypothetical protein